jgi:acyl-CoA oxidase
MLVFPRRHLMRTTLRTVSSSSSTPGSAKLKMSNTDNPQKIRNSWFAPTFPVQKLTDLLDHDNHEMRNKFREFISEPVMVPRYDIPLAEERDLALRRLQRICDNDFISVLDFNTNPLRIFAAHELAAIIDPAMTTKMTVQVFCSL